MGKLKRSLFWVAFYLVIIFFLGQLDRVDRPVINLANYFYILVFVAVPCMVLIPSFYRAPQFVSMIFWASIYFGLSRVFDRALSAPSNFETIFTEVALLELGVWVSYQLAVDLAHSESLVDTMAQSAFPNQATEIENAANLIRTEITRSRRYHRPLSLIVLQVIPENKDMYRQLFKSFQRDLLSRFSSARMGQLIGERIRQTDILLRDRLGKFIVLCPETDKESVLLLGKRIHGVLEDDTGLQVSWGCSSFPEEALTFEDLVERAREQMKSSNLQKEFLKN
jgi:hypothetical protein